MSTTLQIDSLVEIKARIQTQQAEVATSIAETRRELEQEQQKLTQLQTTMAGQRHDLRTWQTLHREREMNCKIATQDLEHVRGTDFEVSRKERLAAATAALEKSTSEVAQLTQGLEKATLESSRLQEQCQVLAQRLDALTARQADLQATYARFDLEDQQARMARHREALGACDAEISDREAKVLDARQYRAKVFDQAAEDLLPWSGDAACVDFLSEHIRVEDPPDVVAALAQVEQAKQAHALASRSRAQSGDDVLPTIAGYAAQVTTLLARVEELRKQTRGRAARALLAKLQQPAPVPDDLAEAQALHAQAQVQANVVVEEAKPAPGPAKQRITPQRGMRTFAPLGAMPTVAPSLLNPTVKE